MKTPAETALVFGMVNLGYGNVKELMTLRGLASDKNMPTPYLDRILLDLVDEWTTGYPDQALHAVSKAMNKSLEYTDAYTYEDHMADLRWSAGMPC